MGIEFVVELSKLKDFKDSPKLVGESNKDISTRVNEIENAISTVKNFRKDKPVKVIKNKFESPKEQYDLNSTSGTSYQVNSSYTSSDFDSGKYYDSLKQQTYTASSYEHKFLQDAQRVAQEVRMSDETGKSQSNIDLFVDIKHRDVRIDMKTQSEVVWRLMYDGKLVFN